MGECVDHQVVHVATFRVHFRLQLPLLPGFAGYLTNQLPVKELYGSNVGDVGRIELIGGHPAVDFVNTLGGDHQALVECLHSYADLLIWAERTDVIDAHQAETLRALASAQPADATRALTDALALRASVDQVLRAAASHEAAPDEALDHIRDVHTDAIGAARLRMPTEVALEPPEEHSQTYDWTWPPEPPVHLASVVWQLCSHVVDFLRFGDLHRLKHCVECRWIFLDESRNNSRRWCSMKGCGARAKMRRYRASQSRASQSRADRDR
jgi:predicted RNA-binding Zn ribbon-like protein